MPFGEPEEEQPQQPCFSRLLAGKPSPGIPRVVLHAEALPAVATCASYPGTQAHAASTSLFDGVGTSSETGTERVQLVFMTALRLQ